MPRYKKFGEAPTGIKGVVGVLILSTENPLNGARVRRVKLTPGGSTVVEMIDDEHPEKQSGSRFSVAAGIFQRRAS